MNGVTSMCVTLVCACDDSNRFAVLLWKSPIPAHEEVPDVPTTSMAGVGDGGQESCSPPMTDTHFMCASSCVRALCARARVSGGEGYSLCQLLVELAVFWIEFWNNSAPEFKAWNSSGSIALQDLDESICNLAGLITACIYAVEPRGVSNGSAAATYGP